MGRSNDIRAAVIDDLTFDPDVDASGITVEDRDGEVALAGSVPGRDAEGELGRQQRGQRAGQHRDGGPGQGQQRDG